MRLSLIAAMSANRVIGLDGRLPWHIPGEQLIFKRHTVGKVLACGRKTCQSIGRALPDRVNICITRQKSFGIPGYLIAHSLDETVRMARPLTDELMIGGGGDIFAQALPLADAIYLTTIHREFEGDTFFPNFSAQEFVETEAQEIDALIPYRFAVWRRK